MTIDAHAVFEGNGQKIALQVVTPLMIDAGEIGLVAIVFPANHCAAMGTLVDHDVDPIVVVADYNNGGFTDKGRFEIAVIGNFSRQPDIVPNRPAKNAFLFTLIVVAIKIDPIWNAAGSLLRPW